MSWEAACQKIENAIKQLSGEKTSPRMTVDSFSIEQMVQREFELEELWRARLDRITLRYLETGDEPESSDECYLVGERLLSAITIGMVYVASDEISEFGLNWSDEQKLNWLVVDSWRFCGVGLYKDRRQTFLDGIVFGVRVATDNPDIKIVFKK